MDHDFTRRALRTEEGARCDAIADGNEGNCSCYESNITTSEYSSRIFLSLTDRIITLSPDELDLLKQPQTNLVPSEQATSPTTVIQVRDSPADFISLATIQ